MGALPDAADDWRVTAGIVSGGHFLSHFYILSLPPLFPLLKAEFALSNTELGVLVAVVSVATLLQLPVGGVVDRVGAKRVVVAGIALAATGVVLIGLAPSYLAMLGFALVSGLGQAAFHPADYALLDAVTDEGQKGKSFSLHTFGGYAGFATAPLVVGTIGLAYSWRTALVAVGIVGVLYAAVVAAALEPVYLRQIDERDAAPDVESIDLREDLRVLLRPAVLLMVAFFVVISMGGKGISTFTTILVVDGFGLAEAVGNTALTAYFAAASVGILIGGILADRFRPVRVISTGLSVVAGSVWLVVSGLVPPSGLAIVFLFGFAGLAGGIIYPSRDRLVSALSSSGSTGKSFGFVFTGLSIGGLVSPPLLGAIIDATAVAVAFVLVGGFYLVAAIIALSIGTGAVAPSVGPHGSGGD